MPTHGAQAKKCRRQTVCEGGFVSDSAINGDAIHQARAERRFHMLIDRLPGRVILVSYCLPAEAFFEAAPADAFHVFHVSGDP